MSRGSSIIIKITDFKLRKKERREEKRLSISIGHSNCSSFFYKMNLEPLAYLAIVTSYGL